MHPNLEANRKRGIYPKYIITKVDGSPVDPGAEYFVLRLDSEGGDPKHVEACRSAILAYADAISTHLPILSAEIKERFTPVAEKVRQVPEGWVEAEAFKIRLAPDLCYPFSRFTGRTLGQVMAHKEGPDYLAQLQDDLCALELSGKLRSELKPLLNALRGLELPDLYHEA